MDNPRAILDRVALCPFCGGRLANKDRRPRRIPCGGGWKPGWVYRKRCKPCRRGYTLLPDFIRQKSPYHRDLHEDRVWNALHGESCRARSFFQRHQIQHPAEDKFDSWSDLLDEPALRTRPGYQLLNRWGLEAAAWGRAAVNSLFRAWLVCGAGLKYSSAQLARIEAPVPLRPLTIALLFWIALRPEGCLRDEFNRLLRYLSQPSPIERREPGRAFAYDGRARASRASPDLAAREEMPL